MACMTMDQDWISMRNVWAIITIGFASFIIIFDCKYTEVPALEDDEEDQNQGNSYKPSGPTVTINLGFGGNRGNEGGGVTEFRKEKNIDYPNESQLNENKDVGKKDQMFVSDNEGKNKYKLDLQDGDGNQGQEENKGTLAQPIY